ncbi:potassium channel subfamily K member 18-like [Schistocerca piceifrons]|uniref:potassium channel subfamily K member 18-like n=1 Tax=Schistocerca piceifrons TaxID=274613 RepID=UPI001F5EF5F9|nr:potassium channel subfamily K member 18-like [Schistocerca piceifrons]
MARGRAVSSNDRCAAGVGCGLASSGLPFVADARYGNLAPKTAAGKVATMVYAIVGVPLMLLCLSNLGALLADTFQFAYSQAHACSRITVVVVLVQVRQLLTECAEYQVSQAGGGAPDAAATRLLRELRRPAPGADDDDDDDEDEDDEEERSAAAHDTPSRVPLIWRPTEQQQQQHQAGGGGPQLHLQTLPHKRPPTPPPRRVSHAHAHAHQPDVTADATPASCTATADSAVSGANHDAARHSNEALQSRVPVWLVLVVLTGYICLGAAIFARWEDWSFLDGAYFCFITLSTIGFGDLVPGKSLRTFQQRAELQLVACCAYLLLGLVLIAMSFSLVQAEVVARCRQAAASLGLLKR